MNKGFTIAGLAALAALITANLQVFERVGGVLTDWSGHPQFVAVFVGIAFGVLFTTWVPYTFGDALPSSETLRHWIDEAPAEAKARLIAKAKRVERIKIILRFSTAAMSFAIAWRMSPSEFGALWALIAGMAGPQAYKSLTWATYQLFPAIKPQVLKQTTPQLVAAAADIPTEGATPEATNA